jgi:hypothetical protein
MSTKFTRMTRVAGLTLALASGAMVVLGTAPASADSVKYEIKLRTTSTTQPSMSDAESETRPAADRRCVATYGYRAREVTFLGLKGSNGTGGNYNWEARWECHSN